MPRKGPVPPREIDPDPRYGDVLVAKVVNKVMWDGKKTIARKIVYEAMEIAAKKTKLSPLEALHRAIEKVRPEVEVRARRVGGATYQVPIEVSERRSISLAIRWLVEAARNRSEYRMAERLGNEIVDAIHERGGAFKKREDTHRMAEANQAFAHFRW